MGKIITTYYHTAAFVYIYPSYPQDLSKAIMKAYRKLVMDWNTTSSKKWTPTTIHYQIKVHVRKQWNSSIFMMYDAYSMMYEHR